MRIQMKQVNLRRRGGAAGRRTAGHAQEDHILDPYQRQQKLDDDTICPQCGAVYQKGRWQWGTRPENGHEALCPACRRINDKFPAGVVELRGPLGPQQKDEIIHLARHQEEAEKGEHPLNRIINIDEDTNGIVIKTTDIHLTRRIGEAVERTFHGSLNEDFDEGGYFVRVNWTAGT
jgi:NMD protein affecting ribosome stability and mRNA decay